MRRTRPLAAATMLAAALAGSCGGEPAVAERAAQPIMGGTPDEVHRNVVGISIAVGAGGFAACSGSLIAPNVVLTARHCVSPISTGERLVCETYTDANGQVREASRPGPPFAASAFRVTTSPRIDASATFVRVSAVRVPPDSTGAPLCGRDIALLVLATPVRDVPPLEPRLDLRPSLREAFTAVGYGAVDGTGADAGERRMRAGLRVEHVGAVIEDGSAVIADSEWVGNVGSCQGDSGGPPLDAAGAVFGVLSRVVDECRLPTYTRVDSWRDWLRAEASAATGGAGLAPPAWIAPPVAESAALGASCRGATECVDGRPCVVLDGRRQCAELDCAACPAGFHCGAIGGTEACVSDAPPPPEDAGGAPGSDGGADGGTGGARGGCATAPTHRAGARYGALGLLAVAAGGCARRRPRRP